MSSRKPIRFRRFAAFFAAAAACAALSFPAAAGLNPLNPGLPPMNNVYGLNNIPNNNVSAMCVACHTTTPVGGNASTHFVRQTARTTNNQVATERLNAWDNSGAQSKYGNFSGSPPTSVTGTNGELICESCHNIVRNVAGGNNLVEKSFLADDRPASPNSLTQATKTLCEGCHVSNAGHHPMTGDTVTSGGVLTNTDAASAFTRVYVSQATQMPSGSSSGVYYGGSNRMGCLSCHANGHDGYTGTGARILRRGWAGTASVNPVTPGSAVVGNTSSTIARQADSDLFTAPSIPRLVPNWQPLCDACHKVDDN